jgi:hypothetical protein
LDGVGDLLRARCHGAGHAPGRIAGITRHPVTPWILKIARQMTNPEEGIPHGKRHLIVDRDEVLPSVPRLREARED